LSKPLFYFFLGIKTQCPLAFFQELQFFTYAVKEKALKPKVSQSPINAHRKLPNQKGK